MTDMMSHRWSALHMARGVWRNRREVHVTTKAIRLTGVFVVGGLYVHLFGFIGLAMAATWYIFMGVVFGLIATVAEAMNRRG